MSEFFVNWLAVIFVLLWLGGSVAAILVGVVLATVSGPMWGLVAVAGLLGLSAFIAMAGT